MPFTSDLVVRESDNPNTKWVLVEKLTYTAKVDDFEIPAGFPTDFASVPRPILWLIPSYGRYTKAAVLHDYLLHHGGEAGVDRCDADGIFRRTLREAGVGYVRRRIMWAGVRWAGGVAKCGFRQYVLVVLITVMALPLLLPFGVVVGSLGIFSMAEIATRTLRKALGLGRRPPPPPSA